MKNFTQIAYAKACGKMYHAPVFANEMQQRRCSRVVLLVCEEGSMDSVTRNLAEILFKEYPDIKKGYYLSMRLGLIYHQCKFKDIAGQCKNLRGKFINCYLCLQIHSLWS